MTKWNIKYRHATGVSVLHVEADTREEAEDYFAEVIVDNDMFGVIVKTTPT